MRGIVQRLASGAARERAGRVLLGPPLPEAMPQRVADAIGREQARSEVLVSLIQLGAIVLFAVLYSLTPKAFPPDVPFEPVPIALVLYALFTFWRLGLALRQRLTRPILAVSVVVDIALLMVTIWSFHLQYQAPPALYLKAPTLMYVFILIALRTLRFEPAFVLLAGISAALGWLALVAYAVLAGGGPAGETMITRDFAEYMMSYSILIGAEVDKIVSILVVTAILALALHRARKLLVRAAVEGQAASDLKRFFAPEIAGRITGSDAELVPGRAELREAAIMFIDLRGFTGLGERLAPADVMQLLGEYQALMTRAVRAAGGSIDKFMGDGILASFGAVRPSDSAAAEALAAIEAVLETGQRWSGDRARRNLPAPAVAAAITTGTVMFGTVGDAQRLEYTVLGEPVNLAAKLEKHTKVERSAGIVMARTFDSALGQGFTPRLHWELRPARTVDGLGRAIDLRVC
ncbi:MAG: adenylate/guanylate cyclase domain-containing protein [Geminicoccaceae bacterium]|jgi:adenylate cyclase|nr:adenylate/guanylate cyclase domain-containing protein [Geminicoccaceae bacterium]HRY23692.1 adenylate/guanylate cyclase domain-containing protein [Geminicoccaceae bacterium]